jgi:serine/threonine protein kinase
VTALYLHPGKRLGASYLLESLIGTGQFGQVWRAKKLNPPSDVPVALKVPIDPQRGEEALMADGQYMLSIPPHPGIVSVNWQGRVGSQWVVEMEFVNGPPLSRLMEDEARWAKVTFEDIIRWFKGVAEALTYLHQHRLVHGDLKPDNLLLDEQSGELKITDFGTSRRLTDNLIRTTRQAGAWAYQAPEIQQANQRGAVSDLFSVGAVIYHAVTGRLPRPTIQALLTSAPVTRPRQFNPLVPPELDELIMQLLVNEPGHRLESASELQKRLQVMLSQDRFQKLPTPQPLPPGTGYLDRAAALLAQGKLEDARAAAAEATLHSTGLVPALELYAKLSDKLGYTEDAIPAFMRILSLESTPEETRRSAETSLADLYLRLHRYEDAEEYVERALQVQPVPRAVVFKAAIVLGACTKLQRALDLLESLELEHPREGTVLEKKAWILWLLHRYEDAARVARDALEIMPESAICLRRLIDYETLGGNNRRAEYYRARLEQLYEHTV